jgi:hypothetical protein
MAHRVTMDRERLGLYHNKNICKCFKCSKPFIEGDDYVRNNSSYRGAKLYCIECAEELYII